MRLSNIRESVAPATAVVTTAEAKAHLRVVHSDEDTYIDALVSAATTAAERIAMRAFVTRTYTGQLDYWPVDREIIFPYPPLASVTGITYTDEDDSTSTWAATNYVVDTHSEPGRVVFVREYDLPSVNLQRGGAITVTFTAGYGAASAVPEIYKQAIKLLVGHFYENREEVIVVQGITMGQLPMAARNLLMLDRGYS